MNNLNSDNDTINNIEIVKHLKSIRKFLTEFKEEL